MRGFECACSFTVLHGHGKDVDQFFTLMTDHAHADDEIVFFFYQKFYPSHGFSTGFARKPSRHGWKPGISTFSQLHRFRLVPRY